MKKILLNILLCYTAIGFSQKNLVLNGGLDIDTQNWNGDVLTNNPYDKKIGDGCGMINQFTGVDWKGVDQIIDIPKKTYAIEFSVWTKCTGIKGGKDKWNAGIMNAVLLNGGNKEISSESIAEVHGTENWKLHKKTVLLPADARKIKILLALAQTSGTILFDEVKAITITQEAYIKMQAEIQAKKDEMQAKINGTHIFKNGNFEEALNNWQGSGTISNQNPKEGKSCMAITTTKPEWAAVSQMVDIEQKTKSLEISAWLKAQNIEQGKDPWNHGMIILEFTKDGTTKVVNDNNLADTVGNTNWTLFSKTIPVPEDAKKYRIMIALNNAAGTLLADDIKVNQLKQ